MIIIIIEILQSQILTEMTPEFINKQVWDKSVGNWHRDRQ